MVFLGEMAQQRREKINYATGYYATASSVMDLR